MLKESAYISPEDPAGLLRIVWFFVTLYWCRRGCEGQRSLRRDSFKFEEDAEGNEYAIMSHQERTKNHQGGLNDRPSDEILTRLYSANTPGDAYSCLKLYTSKLNPEQEAFFQRPKSPFKSTDSVWYENKPLGLATMMKDISTGAGLSKIYTNHSVRATTITLLSDSSVPNRHIMSISGHASEQSLASYNARPSTTQLKHCSKIISRAVGVHCKEDVLKSTSRHDYEQTSCVSTSSSSTSISCNSPSFGFPTGLFQSCNIGHAQVFVLPPNTSNK